MSIKRVEEQIEEILKNLLLDNGIIHKVDVSIYAKHILSLEGVCLEDDDQSVGFFSPLQDHKVDLLKAGFKKVIRYVR